VDKERSQINWTENAIIDFNNVISYLTKNWSDKVAENFRRVVEAKLNVLSHHPFIGLPSQKHQDIRSILLTKHNRLYYRVKDNSIELLNILDTRQNPKTNPY
jgi:plasmid stabilization system protein ParE